MGLALGMERGVVETIMLNRGSTQGRHPKYGIIFDNQRLRLMLLMVAESRLQHTIFLCSVIAHVTLDFYQAAGSTRASGCSGGGLRLEVLEF